ncbi:MAG TPA: sugar nucleotide-binding protein, partial [Caulobacter sp.]|nr:sugar nucleotide-binding protein [Caulobacter sp.]
MADPVAILVTGGAGQVGAELQAYAWPAGVKVLAPARSELDLTDAASVSAWFSAHPV